MTALEQRERTFEALERGPLDVLIVGGGIVGTGIARDLALRGLKVGLVEQCDLASGTSSRPNFSAGRPASSREARSWSTTS